MVGPPPPQPLEFTSNPAASRHAAAGRTRIGFRSRIIARTPWFSKACPLPTRPCAFSCPNVASPRFSLYLPSPLTDYHLRLTTAVLPPRGRLDGNCPSGQVAGAIRAGYARNYRPIHEISFGRRDAQPQDFACPNIPPVAGLS